MIFKLINFYFGKKKKKELIGQRKTSLRQLISNSYLFLELPSNFLHKIEKKEVKKKAEDSENMQEEEEEKGGEGIVRNEEQKAEEEWINSKYRGAITSTLLTNNASTDEWKYFDKEIKNLMNENFFRNKQMSASLYDDLLHLMLSHPSHARNLLFQRVVKNSAPDIDHSLAVYFSFPCISTNNINNPFPDQLAYFQRSKYYSSICNPSPFSLSNSVPPAYYSKLYRVIYSFFIPPFILF